MPTTMYRTSDSRKLSINHSDPDTKAVTGQQASRQIDSRMGSCFQVFPMLCYTSPRPIATQYFGLNGNVDICFPTSAFMPNSLYTHGIMMKKLAGSPICLIPSTNRASFGAPCCNAR
jgi:hypothetical protein